MKVTENVLSKLSTQILIIIYEDYGAYLSDLTEYKCYSINTLLSLQSDHTLLKLFKKEVNIYLIQYPD